MDVVLRSQGGTDSKAGTIGCSEPELNRQIVWICLCLCAALVPGHESLVLPDQGGVCLKLQGWNTHDGHRRCEAFSFQMYRTIPKVEWGPSCSVHRAFPIHSSLFLLQTLQSWYIPRHARRPIVSPRADALKRQLTLLRFHFGILRRYPPL